MNIYILPSSFQSLGDKIFDASDSRRQALRSPNNIFWDEFGRELRRAGHTPHTFDFWNKDAARPDDVLFVMNHPGETFLWRAAYFFKNLWGGTNFASAKRKFLLENYKRFLKRILVQIEPWVTMPYVYKHLKEIRVSGLYTKIFIHSKGYGDAYNSFDYFNYWNRDITSSYFDAPKNRFLAFMNGNILPHALSFEIGGRRYRELYGERLRAIRYFSGVPGFDLYGWRWDKMPRHPFYFWYGKYARQAWRGTPEDKTKTFATYKFVICFENCEAPGWVSEKIYDCFAAGCIPIYLGAPDIASIVPPECFIDFRWFKGNYAELRKFLVSMPEKREKEYRRAIRVFLVSRTKRIGIDAFVKKVLQ